MSDVIRPEFPADIFEYQDNTIEVIFPVRTDKIDIKLSKNILKISYKEESENETRTVERVVRLPEDYVYVLEDFKINNNVCTIKIRKKIP